MRSTGRRRPRRTRGSAEREPGHPTGVLLVCAVIAGTQMTWGLVIPVLPIYADRLGAGAAMLGAVVAAFGLGRLVVDLPAGAVAQRIDQRHLLIGAVAAVAVCTLLTAAVTSIHQLVAVRFLTGLAGGVAIVAGQALLANSDPGRLGRTMGALQAYQLAGGALGPVLGGVLVGVDARLPFVAGGALLVVLVVLGIVRPVPQRQPRSYAPMPPGAPSPRLWTASLVSISLVGFAIFFVRFGGQQFLFPVLAYEQAGLSPTELGIAIAVTTLVSLGLVRMAGSLTDRWGRRPVVILSTTALGLVTLGFLGSGSALVFLGALALTGVATAFTGPPSGAYLAESVAPQKRGMAVGVYRTCGDAATLIGPLCLGWLVAAEAEAAAVVLLSATTVLAALLFTLLTRTRRGSAGVPAPDVAAEAVAETATRQQAGAPPPHPAHRPTDPAHGAELIPATGSRREPAGPEPITTNPRKP